MVCLEFDEPLFSLVSRREWGVKGVLTVSRHDVVIQALVVLTWNLPVCVFFDLVTRHTAGSCVDSIGDFTDHGLQVSIA